MKKELLSKEITNLKKEKIEEIVKKAGYTRLDWLPHSVDSYKKNIQYMLCGMRPDYKGPYEYWLDEIVFQIVNKKREHIKYVWASHYRDKKNYKNY